MGCWMLDFILALNMFCSNQFSAFHRAHCQAYMNRCSFMVKAPDFVEMYRVCTSEYVKIPDPRKKKDEKAAEAEPVQKPKETRAADLPRKLPQQVKKPGGHALEDLEKK